MAKGTSTSRERIAQSRSMIPSKQDATKAAMLAAAPRELKDAVEQSAKEKIKAVKQVLQSETKLKKFVDKTRAAAKTETGIDVIGGLSAQALNELGSLGFRMMGEWSEKTAGPDGFWASNVDLTQSLPGAIGSVIYIIERALRPDFDPDDKALPEDQRRPYSPNDWRRGISEASKVLSHLGLSNSLRAIRFRFAESIDERREKQDAIKDRDRLLRLANEEVERLKAQVRLLQNNATPR